MQPAQLAGNVWNDDILGSLEFATKVSGAKLIAVVAHTSCAAIQGAVDNVKLGHITGLLDKIQPAVAARSSIGEKHTSKDLAFVDKVVGENVRLVGADISRGSVISTSGVSLSLQPGANPPLRHLTVPDNQPLKPDLSPVH